jgi:hypothetical protein
MSTNSLAPMSTNTQSDADAETPQRKWRRILKFLADGGRLTRFDAERLGEHALNSTVAFIGSIGITVSREPWKLQGRFGAIHCKRYWLEPEQRQRALALLVSM